jgi:hypothetical protein
MNLFFNTFSERIFFLFEKKRDEKVKKGKKSLKVLEFKVVNYFCFLDFRQSLKSSRFLKTTFSRKSSRRPSTFDKSRSRFSSLKNWVYEINTQKNGNFTQTVYTFLKQ